VGETAAVGVEYSTATDGASASVVRGPLTTTYGYDAEGNQTRTTDAMGNATYTYYDVLGRTVALAMVETTSANAPVAATSLVAF
jgi:YD repeat-containing protein